MLAVQFLQAVLARRAARRGHAARDRARRCRGSSAPPTSVPADQELPDDFDVVIETAGSASAARDRRLAAAARRPAGPDGDPGAGCATGSTRRTSSYGSWRCTPSSARRRDAWAHTVRVFGAGLLDPLPLITHELPLSEIREAFRVMSRGPGGRQDPAAPVRALVDQIIPPDAWPGGWDGGVAALLEREPLTWARSAALARRGLHRRDAARARRSRGVRRAGRACASRGTTRPRAGSRRGRGTCSASRSRRRSSRSRSRSWMRRATSTTWWWWGRERAAA